MDAMTTGESDDLVQLLLRLITAMEVQALALGAMESYLQGRPEFDAAAWAETAARWQGRAEELGREHEELRKAVVAMLQAYRGRVQ
jgi:hypothetical protein